MSSWCMLKHHSITLLMLWWNDTPSPPHSHSEILTSLKGAPYLIKLIDHKLNDCCTINQPTLVESIYYYIWFDPSVFVPGVFERSLKCPDPTWWAQTGAGDLSTSPVTTGWTLVWKEAFCARSGVLCRRCFMLESYQLCPFSCTSDPDPEHFRWLPK